MNPRYLGLILNSSPICISLRRQQSQFWNVNPSKTETGKFSIPWHGKIVETVVTYNMFCIKWWFKTRFKTCFISQYNSHLFPFSWFNFPPISWPNSNYKMCRCARNKRLLERCSHLWSHISFSQEILPSAHFSIIWVAVFSCPNVNIFPLNCPLIGPRLMAHYSPFLDFSFRRKSLRIIPRAFLNIFGMSLLSHTPILDIL